MRVASTVDAVRVSKVRNIYTEPYWDKCTYQGIYIQSAARRTENSMSNACNDVLI